MRSGRRPAATIRWLGGGLAPRVLPASERGEHVTERRQGGVRGRPLLVIDHQKALGARAQLIGDRSDRATNLLRGGRGRGVASPPRLLGEDTYGAAPSAGVRGR